MRAALLAGLVAAVAWLGPPLPGPSALESHQGAAAAATGEPAVTISAEARPEGLELRLDGAAPIPAAVFQRGGVLWVLVAGGHGEIAVGPSLERPDVAVWLTPIASEPAGRRHMLRLALRRSVEVEVETAAAGWRIHLRPADGGPPPAEADDRFARSVERGALAADADGELLEVLDPATGERLGVLLSATAGLRQTTPVRLVDLELLPSAQGLVWRPLADGVTASLDAGRLILLRPGGLRLSHGTAMASVDAGSVESVPPAETESVPALPSLPIGLAALGPTELAARQRARLDLLAGMRQLAGLPRAIARLELAKLYLADALGPEARTALELIDTASLAEPAARLLSLSKAVMAAAAAAVTGQHDRALATLLDRRLDEDPEVALWRAYAAARATRWGLATQEWARSGELLEGYPAPLRRLLGLEMASAMAEQGDAGAALTLIDQLRSLALSVDTQARLSLIEGLGLARTGRSSEADRAFQSASAHGDKDNRARAAFLLTSLRQERGTLSTREAVAALAAQQPGWRDHPWEARMLRRLAELQSATGQRVAALASWEAARARAPDAKAAAAIADDLRDRLRGLLSGAGEDALSPVAALALYRTYEDLLGDDVGATAIRLGLATRAAENGLLETAATLLHRPTPGQPRPAAYDAASLALAEALGDDEGALARLTGAAAMPAAQGALPTRLRAAAAYRSGDAGATVAALAGVPGGDAARLRWAALRQQNDWAGIARTAAAMLPPDDATPLDPAAMDAAVWLTLAELELGQPDQAIERAQRLSARIGDDGPGALLMLAGQAGPRSVATADLPAATGVYAASLRQALDKLPPLPGDHGAASVRSAAERSNPAG